MLKIFTDNSHRDVQAKALAARLPSDAKIAIGVGAETAEKVLAKKANGYFAVQILDPQKRHDEFDLLVLPAHEPFEKRNNVITTYGLINNQTAQQARGDEKVVAVLVGGKHVGGNFTETDAVALADIINKIKGKVFITTSRRTEIAAAKKLREMARHDAFYDYNYPPDGVENPYQEMLERAAAVIVTADSARMVSEACSSGRPVYIFTPEQTHFSYIALRDLLVKEGYAHSQFSFAPTKLLDEAGRVAQSILERYLSL